MVTTVHTAQAVHVLAEQMARQRWSRRDRQYRQYKQCILINIQAEQAAHV
jgi:hypothetical protein